MGVFADYRVREDRKKLYTEFHLFPRTLIKAHSTQYVGLGLAKDKQML